MKNTFTLYVILSGLLLSFQSVAQDWEDDEWSEEISPWQWSGFSEALYGQRIWHNPVIEQDTIAEQIRLHANVDYQSTLMTIKYQGDAFFSGLNNDTNIVTRQFYTTFSPYEFIDIKAGKQILTWGTGDLLFLNDFFAKDWQAFFSGLDMTYLKAPSNSIKTSFYSTPINVDIVWTPEFTPDNYIRGELLGFYSAEQNQIIAPNHFPVDQPNESEWAIRAYNTFPFHNKEIEWALYYYKGFFKQPLSINRHAVPTFSPITSYGASGQTSFLGGLINIESVYINSETNEADFIYQKNDEVKWLIGYEHEIIKKLTGSWQYYHERPFQSGDNRTTLTMRLEYQAMQAKLHLSLMSFYSPDDKDHYLRPSVNYRFNDQFNFTLGGNLMSGEPNSFFGQFNDDSNIYTRIRIHF